MQLFEVYEQSMKIQISHSGIKFSAGEGNRILFQLLSWDFDAFQAWIRLIQFAIWNFIEDAVKCRLECYNIIYIIVWSFGQLC